MKDTDGVSQGEGILQQRADLKDWSRLKLIEIPFVAFGVFYVSPLFSASLPLCRIVPKVSRG